MFTVDYKCVPSHHDYQIPFIHTRRAIKTSETLISNIINSQSENIPA